MHNTWLIAKREYLERVRTKAFILSTILIPAFMALVVGAPAYFATKSIRGSKHIAVVSADARLVGYLRDELNNGGKKDASKQGTITVDQVQPDPSVRATLTGKVEQKTLDGYLWIDAPSQEGGARGTYASRSSADIAWNATLEGALRRAYFRERLLDKGISAADVDTLNQPADLSAVQITGAGKEEKKNQLSAFMGAFGLMFLLYLTVIIYGVAVSRSVIEEKTSRVFEVMLASVKPTEMMAGKILGVGAVGLTQIAIWVGLSAMAITGPAAAGLAASGVHISVSPSLLVYFAIFFLLGFAYYSTLAAALGAMVNSDQELQQLNLVLTGPLILCMVMLSSILASPGGTLSTVLSLLPPCTPLVMYMRIALQTPPFWQIALSIALMLGTNFLLVLLCSRIYRVGILMYGKRPTLPEILKWLKYS